MGGCSPIPGLCPAICANGCATRIRAGDGTKSVFNSHRQRLVFGPRGTDSTVGQKQRVLPRMTRMLLRWNDVPKRASVNVGWLICDSHLSDETVCYAAVATRRPPKMPEIVCNFTRSNRACVNTLHTQNQNPQGLLSGAGTTRGSPERKHYKIFSGSWTGKDLTGQRRNPAFPSSAERYQCRTWRIYAMGGAARKILTKSTY